ncbi:MAG: DUF2306 domain-containing protein [Burkholderiaceae bacterium]|jgi:putative Mn2+ efflux pump MntP
MITTKKSNWLVPFALIVLSIVPMLAGAVRLFQICNAAPVTSENLRFMTAPLPVVMHIISSVIYSILGAFQFSDSFRQNKPLWHRTSGKWLIPLGLISALSGIWMTLFYARPAMDDELIVANFDDHYLYAMRIMVGLTMTCFICLGLAAIRKRDIFRHCAWMIRAYALALGAGTQVFTHIPWFVFTDLQSELSRTICMGAGWVINALVAEWVISHKKRFANA